MAQKLVLCILEFMLCPWSFGARAGGSWRGRRVDHSGRWAAGYRTGSYGNASRETCGWRVVSSAMEIPFILMITQVAKKECIDISCRRVDFDCPLTSTE